MGQWKNKRIKLLCIQTEQEFGRLEADHGRNVKKTIEGEMIKQAPQTAVSGARLTTPL